MNQQNSHAQSVLINSYRRVYSRMRWLNALAERGLRPALRAAAKLRTASRRLAGSTSSRRRGSSVGGLAFGRMESLEARAMLAADLFYADDTDLTLAFDAISSQYRLLDNAQAVVSSATAASASSGGIRVTGTIGADVLRLDTASLSLAGAKASITFVGAGDDSVAVTADANITMTGSALTVGTATFTLDGFERAELTGGVSANAFTFGDVTIPAITVDGGGNSDTIFSTVADNAENKGLGETLADAGTLGEAIAFTSVENIVGGRGIDVFTFADGTSLPSTLDGGLGSNALD